MHFFRLVSVVNYFTIHTILQNWPALSNKIRKHELAGYTVDAQNLNDSEIRRCFSECKNRLKYNLGSSK